MAALPIPPLNLSSSASSASRGEAAFGSSSMSVNYGQQGAPAWVYMVGAALALLWIIKRKG